MHWHTRWIICSFVGLLANSLLAQSTEFLEGKHVFGNTDLILGCQIASLEAELNDEAKQDLQEIHEFLNGFTGVDTRGLSEIILQFGDDDYRFASAADVIGPTVGIVFRCQEEIPEKTVEKFATKLNLREDNYDDHAYFMRPGIEPAFVFSENSMLIAEKERQVRERNDKIFKIKSDEANREQTWRNTQTEETTHDCPEKIIYKYRDLSR